MTDIVTGWNPSQGYGDWLLDPGVSSLWVDQTGSPIVDQAGTPIDAITTGDPAMQNAGDLGTAVLISLFTDAAAEDDDFLPDGNANRRGWWGGTIGSKLWLRQRDKPTQRLLAVVKADIEDALAWLITDAISSRIDVITEYPRPGMLGAQITIHRTTGQPLSLRFSRLWDTI